MANNEEQEAPPTKEDMQFFGQIVSQMSADASYTTNQLLAIKDSQIRDIEESFLKLYRRMDKVAVRTDSHTAAVALQDFKWLAEDIESRIDPGSNVFYC